MNKNNFELYEMLLENINNLTFVVDLNPTRVVYVNKAYETMWVGKRDELYNNANDWTKNIHPDDIGNVFKAWEECQKSGEFDEEFRITLNDGSIKYIRDRTFPIRNEKGVTYRYVGICEDITKSKELTATLRGFESIVSSTNDLLEQIGHSTLSVITLWLHAIFLMEKFYC